MGFSVYFIGLIIFFLTFIYLPNDQAAPSGPVAKAPKSQTKSKLSLSVIWWMLA